MEANEKTVEQDTQEKKVTDADEKLKEAVRTLAEKADKFEENAREQMADVANAFSGSADKLANAAKEQVAGAATVLAEMADKILDVFDGKKTKKEEKPEGGSNADKCADTASDEIVAGEIAGEEVRPAVSCSVEIEPLAEETVDFDTFCKSDFRVVKVKECIAVPKSKKLLQFTLDDGTGTDRTILSGIHAFYEPEQLVGKTLIAITNLPPRKMMGIDSCGMLISAIHKEDGEEKLNLLIVDDSIPAGAKLC